jgi:hypothetical protein
MEREHPKIQVDDIKDILYIQNGIKCSISSYIQKYFDVDTDDELKSQVTSIVTNVLNLFIIQAYAITIENY